MKKVWIVVLALIALSATNRGFCGDTSDAKVYGWSKDGKNVMVVRTGFMDGIGLDFREVTVLSCQNGKVLLNDYKQSDESGEKPLISEKNQTKSIIKKYKIEASKNKGIYKADKDGVVVWKSGSASYRVYLDVTSSGTTNDYSDGRRAERESVYDGRERNRNHRRTGLRYGFAVHFRILNRLCGDVQKQLFSSRSHIDSRI